MSSPLPDLVASQHNENERSFTKQMDMSIGLFAEGFRSRTRLRRKAHALYARDVLQALLTEVEDEEVLLRHYVMSVRFH
jgi:hypothetical protein